MFGRCLILASMLLLVAIDAQAYPQFEAWVEKHSGASIDCALCHVNPDGPEGVKEGQIRSLNREELDQLNDARAAFQPGIAVDSPILNDFGDRIIQRLGRKKLLEIRVSNPGQLAKLYGRDSDLDGDGISDVDEFLDGTSPVDPRSGDPWQLLRTNLGRRWLDLLMVTLATLLGLFGLNQLLQWFAWESRTVEEPPPDQSERRGSTRIRHRGSRPPLPTPTSRR